MYFNFILEPHLPKTFMGVRKKLYAPNNVILRPYFLDLGVSTPALHSLAKDVTNHR